MNKEQAARLLASVLGKEVSATDISLEDVVAVGLDGKPLGPTETEGYLIFPTKPVKVLFGKASYSQIFTFQIKWVECGLILFCIQMCITNVYVAREDTGLQNKTWLTGRVL